MTKFWEMLTNNKVQTLLDASILIGLVLFDNWLSRALLALALAFGMWGSRIRAAKLQSEIAAIRAKL